MKKFVNLLILAVVFIGFSVNAFAATEKDDDKINFLKEKKIIAGYENGDLGLDKNIKRSELTKILVYALGHEDKAKELQGKSMPFNDVKKDDWANGVIAYAKDNMNLFSGYPDGSFKGQNYITNAEILKVLVCTKKNLDKDAINSAKWPTDWIKWAKEENICTKDLDPKAFASRKDSFIFLYNTIADKLMENSKDSKAESKEVTTDANKVSELKKSLKAIIDSKNDSVLELSAINTESNKKAIAEMKSLIDEAKKLLDKKDLSPEEIKRLEEFVKFEGKKYRGAFRNAARNILVDFEVLGNRDVVNKNNNKKYTALDNNQIKVKTSLEDVKKIGESKDRFVKLNYISKKNYDEIDAISKSTPKYNKEELSKDLYTVEEKDGIITFTISKDLPEDVVILKPIIYVKYADNILFENGDLVYVNAK